MQKHWHNKIEIPNKKTDAAIGFFPDANITTNHSAEPADQRLYALAIAIFEGEGGLILTQPEFHHQTVLRVG